jgi:hypothetical protein
VSIPFPLDPNLNPDPFIQDLPPIDQIQEVDHLPDGSALFNFGGKKESEDEKSSSDTAFYDNLAEKISSDKLSGLSTRLLEEIKQDLESRAEWERTINIGMRYLGFRVEEFRSVPFFQACAAFDSTLSTSLFHSYATARAELFPAAGPARSEIIGTPTPEVEDQGERVKMFMNWYLTQKDKDYYSDSERLLLYVIFCGCAFRKVYQCPINNRPVARLVTPQDFIINHNTVSIESSDRTTEVLYLNRKEILQRQAAEDFIDFEVPLIAEDSFEIEDSPLTKTVKKQEGIRTESTENKSLFKFYEVHVNLDAKDVEPKKRGEKLKKANIPRPYVVMICVTNRKVVSIRRNWKEDDDKFKKLQHYVQYSYLPGFGIYSLGMAQLMGSNTITLTSILRQLVDKGTICNFPGGLKSAGLRIENNDKAIGPAEWVEVETGGLPLSDCIMQMPYSEPSATLLELRKELKEETSTLVASAETEIPEMGSNMPVGTTLALLEVANKVQSTMLRSQHNSLGQELKLIFNLFGEYLPDEPYPFAVPGRETAIMKKDFSDKVNIIPVSDPNVLTSTHRLMRNQALLQLAQSAPELHDMREAYHRMYSSMNIENIDKLLPQKPEPMAIDPIAENMLLLSGKDVAAKLFQEDESHIQVHTLFSQDPMVMGNPQIYASVKLHIQKHKAFKVFKNHFTNQKMQEIGQKVQQALMPKMQYLLSLGFPMGAIEQELRPEMEQMSTQLMQQIKLPELKPEEEEKICLMPDIQNEVAKQDAAELMQQAQQAQQAQQEALDPNKVAVMDIEQRREAAHLKGESDQLKAETEAFKAQLKYEAETAKTDSQREIASEKHQVDMAIAEQKLSKPMVEQF